MIPCFKNISRDLWYTRICTAPAWAALPTEHHHVRRFPRLLELASYISLASLGRCVLGPFLGRSAEPMGVSAGPMGGSANHMGKPADPLDRRCRPRPMGGWATPPTSGSAAPMCGAPDPTVGSADDPMLYCSGGLVYEGGGVKWGRPRCQRQMFNCPVDAPTVRSTRKVPRRWYTKCRMHPGNHIRTWLLTGRRGSKQGNDRRLSG